MGYKELLAMNDAKLSPGGSTLNSCRATNYMLQNFGYTGICTYFGSIGKDEVGETLKT